MTHIIIEGGTELDRNDMINRVKGVFSIRFNSKENINNIMLPSHMNWILGVPDSSYLPKSIKKSATIINLNSNH
jgi:hypothetical protein